MRLGERAGIDGSGCSQGDADQPGARLRSTTVEVWLRIDNKSGTLRWERR